MFFESFLHVGDVIVRRKDTSHTRIQLIEPLVGEMRVAQIFDPRKPAAKLLWRGVCGAEESISSLSSSREAEVGCSRSDIVGFVTLGPRSSPIVCGHTSSAA